MTVVQKEAKVVAAEATGLAVGEGSGAGHVVWAEGN